MDFIKLAGCHTRNNLEYIGNVAFNSFETAFLPSGSVFVSKIMEGEWILAKYSGSVGYVKRKK